MSSQAEDLNSFNDEEKPYTLRLGRGYTSCERFLENLNSFPASMPPLKCETKIHPDHPEFSMPKWEALDPMENLHTIYLIEALVPRFTITGTSPPTFDAWEADFLDRVESAEVNPRLSTVTVKLDGSRLETLMMYQPRPDECDAVKGPGGYVVVWDEAKQLAKPILGMAGKRDQLCTKIALFIGTTDSLTPTNSGMDSARSIIDMKVITFASGANMKPIVFDNDQL